MNRKRMKLADIRPDPLNPRINGRTVEMLKAGLTDLGQHQDLVVDKNGKILAGHARYDAAVALGWEEVDVVVFAGSEIEARAFALDDNFSAETNRPDTKTVLDMLRKIDDSGQNAVAAGFDEIERAKLMAKLQRSKPDKKRSFNVIVDCVSEEEMQDRREEFANAGYRVKMDIK